MTTPRGLAAPDLATVVGWLACPVCSESLHLDGTSLVCPAGHRFDLARQGYANLLLHAQPRNADTPAMIAARERFLGAGHYAPITEAMARHLVGCTAVLDAGGGTGHHLAGVLQGLPEANGLVADVSVPAVRRAARAHPRMGAVVADTWQHLPVRDAALDAVCCVFAPRNPAEFARVLRPGGRVVVVTPNPGHLAEAREALGLLGIEEDKLDHLHRSTAGVLEPVAEERVTAELDLTPTELSDLVGMGPNAFHSPAPASEGMRVSVDVTVTVLTKPTVER